MAAPLVGPDYWAVLGLQPGADGSAVKRAFRAQARRWHPDLNGNDPVAEERFKLVNEAYAVLSDANRRQRWEQGGDAATQAEDPFARGFPDFEAYLAELFGPPQRQRSDREPDPAGDPDFEPVEPPGEVTAAPPPPPPVQASSDQESLVALTPEQALRGERVELELPDGTCVEVWTPPLAGDGWRLRLAGVVRVPKLEGPVQLRVPAGSSSGRLLRLRGRGLRDAHQCGDQMVEIRIVVPDAISEAEEALYRRLLQLEHDGSDGNR